MENFRRILAAIDLGVDGDTVTAGSRKALRRSLWIADRLKARVTLLHSEKIDEYWDPSEGSFVLGNAASGSRLEVFQKATAEFLEHASEVRHVVRSETPSLAIVGEVLREEIDLVVAAKRTDIDSDERRLGTVARRLLEACPCPVWLEDPRASAEPSRVLAATDLTAVGDRVIELAASVAHSLGAELHIVHAFSVSLEAQLAGGAERKEYEKQKRTEARDRIERALASTPLAGAAKVHVGLTSPTRAVLECIEKLEPGLVVMGTVSRGGIPGFLIGNTAERLIDRIDCALLTIKPADFVCPMSSAPIS